jgi:hypothetical protein
MVSAGPAETAADLLRCVRSAPNDTVQNCRVLPFLNRVSQVRILPRAQTKSWPEPYIEAAATRSLELYGELGISVEGAIEVTVLEACRSSQRLAAYRHIRQSTFGRLRSGGFAVLAAFDYPHFTLALLDLSELTRRVWIDPSTGQFRIPPGNPEVACEGGPPMCDYDLTSDGLDAGEAPGLLADAGLRGHRSADGHEAVPDEGVPGHQAAGPERARRNSH